MVDVMSLGEIRFFQAYEKSKRESISEIGWKRLAELTGLMIVFDKKEIWKDFTEKEAIDRIEEINNYYKSLL